MNRKGAPDVCRSSEAWSWEIPASSDQALTSLVKFLNSLDYYFAR